MMSDWNREQLRAIETAFRNARERRVYLNGQECIVAHLMLVQPAVVAGHDGNALEMDLTDAHGGTHTIRLYTAAWPEDRRQ